MHFSKRKSTTFNLHLHCLVLPCHIICHSAVCFRFRSDVAPASLPLSLARWQHRLRSLQFQLAKLSSEGQMIIIFHQPSHCPEIRGFPKLNHAWWVEVVCSVAINLTRKHVFFFPKSSAAVVPFRCVHDALGSHEMGKLACHIYIYIFTKQNSTKHLGKYTMKYHGIPYMLPNILKAKYGISCIYGLKVFFM